MFQWLAGARRRNRRSVVDALYAQIVAAARRPRFYSEWQTPDTPLGRFEMLSVHMFLFLHRLRGAEGAAHAVAQDVTDQFFHDVDHSLRELGIGDLGVPKRIKKLARMFYGRLSAYGEAVDRGDVAALAEALRRNIRPEATEWSEATDLANYILRAHEALKGLDEERLLTGELSFAPVEDDHDTN
ncbi:ubiquinol-cytochrome C chaperone family protein [Nitratireductor luteus]|uniref:ubiquinol-cytochrome C chaperone family protein n=1 Tax=Nitratireductor luteus TaxID=2976980 RepID=UPI00223F1CE2|nr:ubiquinol-cytochrome C chaperone family protein [Nitratireductor luteus]